METAYDSLGTQTFAAGAAAADSTLFAAADSGDVMMTSLTPAVALRYVPVGGW
jgi:hypothetical protein